MPWRLVDSDLAAPAYAAACDEAMMMARHHDIIPNSLHLYRRATPTVSIGYFEKMEEAVDIEQVRSHRVGLVRDESAGGALYSLTRGTDLLGHPGQPNAPGEPWRDVRTHLPRHHQGPRNSLMWWPNSSR